MADSGMDRFVTGMLFGAVVGAAIGLLIAPKPGSETRQLVRERATKYVGPVRERAGEFVGTARERVAQRAQAQQPGFRRGTGCGAGRRVAK